MTAIAKIPDGIDVGFLAELADGSLAIGIASGDISVTCVAPDKTATSSPSASESAGKAGLYTALVPSAFLVTNGVGVYYVAIEVDSSSPEIKSAKLVSVVVSRRDIDRVFNIAQVMVHA